MSDYNEGSQSGRDDRALLPDVDAATTRPQARGADDVGETTPGIADATVGAVDAADAEFAASDPDAGANAPGTSDADGPTEPDDRFDDDTEHQRYGTEDIGTPSALQPQSQGDDPIYAEMGDEGQGDLSPNDM